MALAIELEGITPNLNILGNTQRLIFGSGSSPEPTASLKMDNLFAPIVGSNAITNLDLRNNVLSGYRLVHETSDTDSYGSLKIKRFLHADSVGTELMSFTNDGFINFGIPFSSIKSPLTVLNNDAPVVGTDCNVIVNLENNIGGKYRLTSNLVNGNVTGLSTLMLDAVSVYNNIMRVLTVKFNSFLLSLSSATGDTSIILGNDDPLGTEARLSVVGGPTSGGEQTSIKVISSSAAAKIELHNTSPGGHRYAEKSNSDGSYTIYDGTLNLERMRVDSSGLISTTSNISAASPTISSHLTTKSYVDSLISGLPIYAPTAAKYILQTANGSLPNAQSLAALTTGILKNTTSTGVLSIASNGVDYYSPNNPTIIKDTNTSSQNVSLGVLALQFLTTGVFNTAMGWVAGQNITTGNNNTCFGAETLDKLTTGSFNTAIGSESQHLNQTGSRNTTLGYNTLLSSVGNNDNTAIGTNSGNFLLSGSGNTFLGKDSGADQGTYNNCLLLGYNADTSINNLTNAIALGANASVAASNTMVLGNGVNVVIGDSTASQARLVIKGGVINTTNEESALRIVNSSPGVLNVKMELQHTTGNIFELRSTGVGKFDITNRTTSSTDVTLESTGQLIHTSPRGTVYFTNNATSNSTSANTWQKAAGVTTSSDLSLFTMPVSNRLQYTGSITITVFIPFHITFLNNNVLSRVGYAIFKNGSLLTASQNYHQTTSGSNPLIISGHATTTLAQNDYVELYNQASLSLTTLTTQYGQYSVILI